MTHPLFLDAVGAPAWALRHVVISLALAPLLLAGAIILFFKFLDWLSKRKEAKNIKS